MVPGVCLQSACTHFQGLPTFSPPPQRPPLSSSLCLHKLQGARCLRSCECHLSHGPSSIVYQAGTATSVQALALSTFPLTLDP